MAGNFQNPLYLSTVSYDPTAFRQHLSACSTTGVRTAPTSTTGDLAVTASGSMVLNVAAGFAVIPGTFTTNQNSYVGQNTATSTVTIGTAPGTGQSRIDRIVAVVYDDAVGVQSGGSNEWKVIVVPGTAATTGSQVLPTITQKNFLELAQVLVGANVTQILAANITDVRAVAEHPSLSGRYVNVASSQTVTGQKRFSGKVAKGVHGPMRGYTTFNANRTSTFSLASINIVTGGWTTYVFNNVVTNITDDGFSYNSSTGIFTLDGPYMINGVVSLDAGSGVCGVRIKTGGGSVVYQQVLATSNNPFDFTSLPFFAALDYTGTIHVEVAQESSGTQTQPADNAANNPCQIRVIGLG